jgi:hypothetical protein
MQNVKVYRKSLMILLCVALAGCRTAHPPDLVPTLAANEHVQGVGLAIVAFPLYLAGVRTPKGPPILAKGSHDEIQAVGTDAARADIAAGRLRVAYAATFASSPVGIPPEYWDLIKGWRKVPLPCGCIEPLARPAEIYAEGYNKEILVYLLKDRRP